MYQRTAFKFKEKQHGNTFLSNVTRYMQKSIFYLTVSRLHRAVIIVIAFQDENKYRTLMAQFWQEENKALEGKRSQRHFIHHKYRTDSYGIEPVA